jgi:integrase
VLPLSAFENVRSLPFGHVAATLGTLRRLGVDIMIAAKHSRLRELCVAMILSCLLSPRSKLALVRSLGAQTALPDEHGPRQLRLAVPQAPRRGVRAYTPAELRRFLAAVDRALERPADVVIIGGAAAAIAYGLDAREK